MDPGRFLCQSEDFAPFLQPVRKRGLETGRILSRGFRFLVVWIGSQVG